MNDQSEPDSVNEPSRGEQLALLRRLKLDSYKHRGRSVSGAICKSVLRAIDDRAGDRGCFASQSTLALEVGCGVATVSRAVAALVAQDLITADKVNPWAPNTHHVNWAAVRMLLEGTDGDGQRPRQPWPTAKTAMANGQDRDGQRPRPSAPTARQIAPLIDQLNAPTNRPDEWAAVVAEMFRWGLKSANQAVDAARERGWSIEYVRELFLESGGDRDPHRWEPGQLSNWLTGNKPPPFDVFEVLRRDDQRKEASDRSEQSAAASIRHSVIQSGRKENAKPWIMAGITFRKLSAAGLERFATDDERVAGDRLDAFDRARDQTGPDVRKRTPDVDATVVRDADATFRSNEPAKSLGVNFRPHRVPGTGVDQRRREIASALRAIG